jgi:hypothetical protein
LKNYREEFGELTQEDIDYVFGDNDSVLSITNVNEQNLLNYAGAKFALGIDDLSTSYDPYYSSFYGDMHARNEIDQQRSIISLYNETVNSRRRIQRMTGGKKQGLYVDVEADANNYEAVISETMANRGQALKYAFALTSFAGTWAIRTGLKRNIPQIHPGKQGKHIPSHKNFLQGRSKFTHNNPQALVDRFSGKGQQAGKIPPGMPGFRERVDFGEVIGIYVDKTTGESMPTTVGIIHYSKDGVHIVPARPK